MNRVAIVGTVGLPACYGGWETLVENIVSENSGNYEYSVYCSSTSYADKLDSFKGAKLVYLPISANGISSIFYDIASMVHTLITKPKVVVVLGVSGCIFLPFFKRLSRSKLVVNVDGIEWRRDKWSGFAKRFLKFSELLAVRYADVVIADNKGISDYISSEYGVSSKVISYGGEHALTSSVSGRCLDYFFTVCRIEPENNVEMILEAFSNSSQKYKIIGNWNSSVYGQKLKSKFSNFTNIDLIDPVYDLNVLFDYRDNCKGYIHGHSVGGTNPSLVEIMHFGKQVYAFDCVFNRFTTENQALYFSNVMELKDLINDKSQSDKNKIMKDIAMRRYTWNIVAKQYEELYKEM